MVMHKEDEILLEISRLIDSDRYQVGMRLSAERELGVQLKVCRNTVRTALKTLEAKGIIEIRGNSGSYILRKPAISDMDLADHNSTSQEDMECLFEARRHFDPLVVALAVNRMDAAAIKELKVCLISLSQAIMQNRPEALVDHDSAFRRILANSLKNKYFIDMTELLRLPAERILNLFPTMSEEDKDRLFACYAELYHALKDRDASRANKATDNMLENISIMLLANDSAINSRLSASSC
jgi:DNA-binding FadR family transcriptional regulator